MSKADCIAAKAPNYIGMPYKRGEEGAYVAGPEQTQATDIDCSGLFWALLKDCSVLLNGKVPERLTADGYWKLAKEIAKPERIGDCCWFPKSGAKTHIAIFVGNDTVIEAGNHGPNNTYPGSHYVGTCTVKEMNKRGAVWGRLDTDIGELEDDMTDEQAKTLAKIAEGSAKLSYTVAINNALQIGDTGTAARLNSEFYLKWPKGQSGLPKGWPDS